MRLFLQKMGQEDGFLDTDPLTWLEREDFWTAETFEKGFVVINYHAE